MTMLDMLHALRRGDLAGAKELRLPGGLTEFPPEIFGLADTLEVLDLSGGALRALPDDMGRLRHLRVLFCSGNRFDRLPACLGDCAALSQIGFRGTGLREVPGESLPPALRWLTLTDNRIERLPMELGERPHLQKLMLAGNRLRDLPASLTDAPNLELLRLAANHFEACPAWLTDLPRLAWLSWAGNPFEDETETSEAALVSWTTIETGDLLGEGASGRVYGALWRSFGVDGGRPVALKLFKGAMTSDGLPEREMAACLAADAHPNLTGALGRLVDHPEGLQGLLMPLLPVHWRVLAGPPSLASCSRDIYAPGLSLPPRTAIRIARAIAAAATHLHGRRLLHGDLYAHNILWDGADGDAVLSDFGAASVLPSGGLEHDAEKSARVFGRHHALHRDLGRDLQRIDVRAWGLLLGELLAHCETKPEKIAGLRSLEEACVQRDPKARPGMAEVLDAISAFESDTRNVRA